MTSSTTTGAPGRAYDYMWEERWLREEGYSKFIPEAVGGLMKKIGITMDDVQKVVFPCLFKAEHKAIAKKLGAAPEKVIDTMHEVCGETGAAHPLLMLVAALEQAKPGDGILAGRIRPGVRRPLLQGDGGDHETRPPRGRQGLAGKQEDDRQLHEVPEIPRT